MGLTANFAELQGLADGLQRVAHPEFLRDLSKQLAAEGLFLVQRGFERSQAPDGSSWAPVLRGGQPLRDKGILMNSLTPAVNATGFEIGTSVKYAATHQSGATIRAKTGPYLRFKVGGRWTSKKEVTIPRRQFLPEGELPESWATSFEKVIDDAIATVGGGR